MDALISHIGTQSVTVKRGSVAIVSYEPAFVILNVIIDAWISFGDKVSQDHSTAHRTVFSLSDKISKQIQSFS